VTPENGVDTQAKVSADKVKSRGILLGSCWSSAITFNLDINNEPSTEVSIILYAIIQRGIYRSVDFRA